MHAVAAICSALLVILTLALAFHVSLVRGRTNIIAGDGGDPAGPVMKAVRAHANAMEYAALLIGLFVVLSLLRGVEQPLPSWVAALMIAVTAARGVHAAGILTCRTLTKIHPLKAIGALVTYIGGIVLAGYALVLAA